jgi:arylsulfatase A-like enzyme
MHLNSNSAPLFSGIILSTITVGLSFVPSNHDYGKLLMSDKEGAVPPNVIIIITDDQGYGDISMHGNPILHTPNLDILHQQSIRLTDFHVAPMCTPSRAQLLTGLDAVRTGAVNVSSGRSFLRRELKTMADYFSDEGYKTGIFGKWHLGDNYPFKPEDRGFHYSLWFPSSHVGSVPDYWGNNYFNDIYIHNGERKRFNGYCTDVFFEKSIEWMSDRANRNEPFFAFIPTNTPHQPYYAHKDDIAEMELIVESSPFSVMSEEGRHSKYNFIRFLAMIRNIDMNIGRLMRFLDENNLTENTILIFLTDNGSTFGESYYNAGMRGRKMQLYEGGHRVPFFIRWPQGKGFDQPHDINGLTHAQDVLPTLLDLCGISKQNSFDGMSLAPVFEGKHKVPEDRVIFINYSRMPHGNYRSENPRSIITRDGAAVLWKRWRLLNNTELYDLSSDPMQQHNIINEYPEILKYMTGELDNWWSGVADMVNIPERIIIGSDHENPSRLTACEWLDVFLDQQIQVEAGQPKNSYWLLEVAESGIYDFELRRWPEEAKIALSGKSQQGIALPISSAGISIIFDQGNVTERNLVHPDDESVVFSTFLRNGPITLQTWFYDENDSPLPGAYYVKVKKR